MSYTTRSGFLLEIGSVPRRNIDTYEREHPQPEPPIKAASELGIAVFGDVEEWIEDWDDQVYKNALDQHYLTIGNDHIGLVTPAVRIVSGPGSEPELEALSALGLVRDGNQEDFLRNVVLTTAAEAALVAQEVFYNSTITPRGILEALSFFNLKLDKRPVNIFAGRKTGRWRANSLFTHRRAARYCGYAWESFVELPGPMQSEHLVFYLLEERLSEPTR